MPEDELLTVGQDQQPEQEAELQEQFTDENKLEESLGQELAEMKDKYLRLIAEFDNYKKRMIREKKDLLDTASAGTWRSLLPMLDDFDRLIQNANHATMDDAFREGMQLVYQKLNTILKQAGVEPMVSNAEQFDPDQHEAVTEIPAPTPEFVGKVIDTIEKGYLLNQKIIRHAKVVVGK